MHYVTSEHYAKIRAIVQYEMDSAKRSVNGRSILCTQWLIIRDKG